jgi:hypothetical protein
MRQSLFRKLGVSALAICMFGSFGSGQREDVLRDALAPVLTSNGSAARLYFHTQCSIARSFGYDSPYPRFPQLTLTPKSGRGTALDTVREILRNERDAVVNEDRSGMIRITIGSVPTALLGTRIARLELEPTARWNALSAILAIENTAEVRASMRKLNLRGPGGIIDIIVGPPTGDNRYRHLPSSLENVTLDQALDAVAGTFKQLVVYGECSQPDGRGTISIYLVPLTECDSHLQGDPCFVPEAKMGRPTPLELSPDPSLSPNPEDSAGSPPADRRAGRDAAGRADRLR